MRVLKDGTIKFKASALKAAERMQQPPQPMPVYPRKTTVRVYMGAGWEKGTVQESTRTYCSVWLGRRQTFTRVQDARNIEIHSD